MWVSAYPENPNLTFGRDGNIILQEDELSPSVGPQFMQIEKVEPPYAKVSCHSTACRDGLLMDWSSNNEWKMETYGVQFRGVEIGEEGDTGRVVALLNI